MTHDRRDNTWERISARLDEALEGGLDRVQKESGRSAPALTKLLELLADAQREFQAREIEARLAAARAHRLETDLEQQRRRTDALMRIGRAGSSVRELPALLQLIVDLAVEATATERGLIIVANPSGGRAEFSAACNLDTALISGPEFATSRAIVEQIFRDGKPVATTDAPSGIDPDSAPSIRSLHIRSIVCAPLKNKEGIAGALYVDSRIGTSSLFRHDPELLGTIADQAAVAIDNARLYEDLSRSFSELSSIKSQSDEILEAIASGVVVLDADNTITQFNRAAEMTFGLSASTLVGRNARILNTWVSGFTALLERFRSDSAARAQTEVTGNHFIRGRIVLQVTFFPIRDPQGGAGGAAVVLNDLTDSRALEAENQAQLEQSRRVARSFERYLAPHVVSGLLKDPEAVVLGGTRQTATMLFADIRGFTELSERLMPEEVVELLNRYLAPVVNVIFANLGLLDKFYGDGIMAVFGAPRPSPDDAIRATVAAREILQQVNRLNGQRNLAWPLSVSIGLATGEVVAGHIGSEQRLEYTVIGNAVNLASRLQNMAEPNQILADEVTYEKVKDQLTATRRMARIRGKAALTPVYVLHG
ncbi:MAG: GAF domain-containing protein [Candidatus Eremiobacteraeota bacterium]|nr:GAF domain-containing protein [Candidatus Eremiobacteraeota bacterium]MBC5827244.1 GAF domain-containing protein [Candidatus Eremiobacteraeota bacterium]